MNLQPTALNTVLICVLALAHVLFASYLRTSKEIGAMTLYSVSMALGVVLVADYTGFWPNSVYNWTLLAFAAGGAIMSLIGFNRRNKGTDARKRLFRNLLVGGSAVLAICVVISVWDNIWAFTSSLQSLEFSDAMKHTLWLAGCMLFIIIGFFVLLKGHLNRDNDKGMRTRNVGIAVCTISVLALFWLAIDLIVTLYHS